MSRYIDMDELLKRFEELHKNENNLLNCYNADWIVQFIEGQTIADVQEVKYGEWVPDDKTGGWRCSNCGHATNEKLLKWYRTVNENGWNLCYQSTNPFYCSRCGAKMEVPIKID